ncbi:MAG: HEAT repeat domain-containing protein [Planctomycetota bacterium]|nr:HEAT repeat domain-containing protein [Planctomycetota bacterium]
MRLNSISTILLILSFLSFNCSRAEAQDDVKKKDPGASKSNALESWILNLSSDDPKKQMGAALALRELGPKAQAAVPALIIALNDSNSKVALAAQKALVKIVPKDLTGLIGLLKDPKRETRLRVTQILYDLGPQGSAATTALVGALSDEENLIRQSAKNALGVMGPKAIPILMKGLSAKKAFTRICCAYGLLKADPQSQPALAVLMKEISSKEKWLRREAAGAFFELSPAGDTLFSKLLSAMSAEDMAVREVILRGIGKYGSNANPVLIKALGDTEAKIREIAAQALGRQPKRSEEVTRALIAALDDAKPGVRSSAERSLARVAERALPILIETLEKGSPNAQDYVLKTFVRLRIAPPDALTALLKILAKKNYNRRKNAIVVLSAIGPKAEAAIPALLKIARSSEALAGDASSGIKKIGFHSEASVLALFEIVRVEDRALHRTGESLCKIIGSREVVLLPCFVKGLKDESRSVRRVSARVLGQMESMAKAAIPELLATLDDPDRRVQKEARLALGKMGGSAVPGLVERLRHKDLNQRLLALQILGKIGWEAGSAVPDLIPLLKEKDRRIRFAVLNTIGGIGPNAEAAVPALAKLLEDGPREEGYGIVYALGFIGPKASKAIPALLKFGGTRLTRISAAKTLGHMGPVAVPALIKALKSPTPYTKACAALALGLVQPKAQEALLPLTSALSDFSAVVRGDARTALGMYGEDAGAAAPILVTQWKSGMKFEKRGIVETLMKIGPGASIAAPILIEELDSKDGSVQKTLLLSALGRIGGDPKLLGSVFTKMMKHKDAAIRRKAALGFKAMGTKGEVAIPALFNALKDSDSETRIYVKQSLNQLTPSSAEHIPILLDVMNGSDQSTAIFGVRLLARMGPKAKKAIPAMIGTLKKAGRSLGGEILLALSQIGPEAKSVQKLLVEKLKDRRLRRFALKGLVFLGRDAEAALPEVVELLRLKEAHEVLVNIGPPAFTLLLSKINSERGETKRLALKALAAFESTAASAIPTLLNCLETGNFTNRAEAAKTLGIIRAEEKVVIPALLKTIEERVLLASTKILDSDDLNLANSAIRAIGAFGRGGRSAIPLLTRLAGEPHLGLQRDAMKALGNIGPEAFSALPTLKKVFRGLSTYHRNFAIEAIIRVGAADKAVLSSAIEMAWEHHEPLVFDSAMKAVKGIGPGAGGAVDVLIKLMRDHAASRLRVINVLGEIGPEAKAALPPLRVFLGHPRFKSGARRAIEKIEKELKKKDSAPGGK